MSWHFHKWNLWSEPKDADYGVIGSTGERHVEGRIQDRTCATCGKYQWRKV